MRYASACDGIGAVHVAWSALGWECAWHAEIEPFAAAVTAARCDAGPNLGDIEAIDDQELTRHGSIDLLVGGTPCQSFSVAHLQRGLDDPRGNLALVLLRLADRSRARWLLWENVPGALSSNRGRDLGALLGALGELGYGWAYRVLDARHFGVAQRRRRLFLVAHRGGWQRPAAVLLEPDGGCGSSGALAASRQDARRAPAAGAPGALVYRKSRRARDARDHETWRAADVANTLTTFEYSDVRTTHLVVTERGARRLTMVEWERLQGFSDGYTDVAFRGRPASDARRVRALGNAIAVPVLRWIGKRIAYVDAIAESGTAPGRGRPDAVGRSGAQETPRESAG